MSAHARQKVLPQFLVLSRAHLLQFVLLVLWSSTFCAVVENLLSLVQHDEISHFPILVHAARLWARGKDHHRNDR
jgi:hypothetical protein